MLAKANDYVFFLCRQLARLHLRSRPQVILALALLPLGDGLGVDCVSRGKNLQAIRAVAYCCARLSTSAGVDVAWTSHRSVNLWQSSMLGSAWNWACISGTSSGVISCRELPTSIRLACRIAEVRTFYRSHSHRRTMRTTRHFGRALPLRELDRCPVLGRKTGFRFLKRNGCEKTLIQRKERRVPTRHS